MTLRLALIVIAIVLVGSPYAIRLIDDDVKTRHTQRAELLSSNTIAFFIHVADPDMFRAVSEDDDPNDIFKPKLPATFTVIAPAAMYTGGWATLKLDSEFTDEYKRSLMKNRGFGGGNYDLLASAVRSRCSVDAPEFSVVRLAGACSFAIFPKAVGRPIVVFSISGLSMPYHSHHLGRGIWRTARYTAAVPLNIPVDAPISASVTALSTVIGIVVGLAGLFSKLSFASGTKDATQRLLSQIRKRKRSR